MSFVKPMRESKSRRIIGGGVSSSRRPRNASIWHVGPWGNFPVRPKRAARKSGCGLLCCGSAARMTLNLPINSGIVKVGSSSMESVQGEKGEVREGRQMIRGGYILAQFIP